MLEGLQKGYIKIVLFYIDQESGFGVMCNSELTDFNGFEDAIITAKRLMD